MVTFHDFLDVDDVFEHLHVLVIGCDVQHRGPGVSHLHRELGPLIAEKPKVSLGRDSTNTSVTCEMQHAISNGNTGL